MESKYVYVESPDGLVEVKAFLDAAIPRSFISDRFFRNLAVPSHKIETVNISLRGKPYQEHYAWIQIYVDGNRFREKCRILEGLTEDLVLGSPALACCGFITGPQHEDEQRPEMLLRLKIRPIEKQM